MVAFKRRKWGWYLTLLEGMQWKIKLLYFKEGGEISYQRHHHRAELWLFVFGRGMMRMTDKVRHMRGAGESALIYRGQWHQYTADKRTLVIECQFGGNCSEGDIERA